MIFRRCVVLQRDGNFLVILCLRWQFFMGPPLMRRWSAENERALAYCSGCCSWDCADRLSQTRKNTRFVPHIKTPAVGLTVTGLQMVSFSWFFNTLIALWTCRSAFSLRVNSSFLCRCVAVACLCVCVSVWSLSVTTPTTVSTLLHWLL